MILNVFIVPPTLYGSLDRATLPLTYALADIWPVFGILLIMNTKLLAGAVIAIIIGTLIVIAIFNTTEPEEESAFDLTPSQEIRPTTQPIPNTFSVMSPEEKAAAEEAARVAAEAALNASTTSTSSATSSETSEAES